MDFDNFSNDDDFHSSSVFTTTGGNTNNNIQFATMDPTTTATATDVASLISSLNATSLSPNHLTTAASYAGSDHHSDSDRLSSNNPFSGLNKDSLSVISAPYLSNNNRHNQIKHNLFGSASIAGHVITQASPFDSTGVNSNANANANGGGVGVGANTSRDTRNTTSNFLDKFGSIAERTRDLENGGGAHTAAGLSPPNAATAATTDTTTTNRRSSFLSNTDQSQYNLAAAGAAAAGSSPNSLHEPLTTTSRHQSVSDRIDSYQQEQERRLSFSSSEILGSDNASAAASEHHSIKHNIWNPASAHTFHPSNQSPFNLAPQLQQQQQQSAFFNNSNNNGLAQAQVLSPGAFPTNMYSPFLYPPQQQQQQSPNQGFSPNLQLNNTTTTTGPVTTDSTASDSVKANNENPVPGQLSAQPSGMSKIPGVNLLNRTPGGFMMPPPPPGPVPGPPGALPPFIPYGMFPFSPQGPPPPSLQPLQQHQQQQAPQSMSPIGIGNASLIQHDGGKVGGIIGNGGATPLVNFRGTPSPTGRFNNNNKKQTSNGSSQSPNHHHHQQSNGKNNNNNSRSRNGPATAAYIQRSPVLEDFIANSPTKDYHLKDIYGHGIEFSKDQFGSRFIQAKLSESTEEEKEVIFNEIRDHSYELMSDVFGNYVIQKYFEFGSETQRKVLVETMDSHVRELSLQMYGCRVVQRAIEHINEEQKLQLVKELNNSNIILECCKDANGNHVIQKAIEIVPQQQINFIFDSIKDQIYHLSTNAFGCRVIQKILEFGESQQCEYIISILEKYVDVLLVDKFGNYVVQYILTNKSSNNCDTTKIIEIINDTINSNFVKLSTNKFSSNVVESYIIATPLEQRLAIKQRAMNDNNTELIHLINDPFGNYVVQKLVTIDINEKSKTTKDFVKAIRIYLDKSTGVNSKMSIEKLRNIIKSMA